jgi:hypothetical protein
VTIERYKKCTNITLPTLIDELPNDLRQKIQAMLTADLEAFLASCFKDWRGNATQYREAIFGELTAPQVKDNEVVEDPFPTQANYAKMLQDHRTVTDPHTNDRVSLSDGRCLTRLCNLLTITIRKRGDLYLG